MRARHRAGSDEGSTMITTNRRLAAGLAAAALVVAAPLALAPTATAAGMYCEWGTIPAQPGKFYVYGEAGTWAVSVLTGHRSAWSMPWTAQPGQDDPHDTGYSTVVRTLPKHWTAKRPGAVVVGGHGCTFVTV
jgi:hypothetical protein